MLWIFWTFTSLPKKSWPVLLCPSKVYLSWFQSLFLVFLWNWATPRRQVLILPEGSITPNFQAHHLHSHFPQHQNVSSYPVEGHLVASSKQDQSFLTLTNRRCPDERRTQCLDDSLTQWHCEPSGSRCSYIHVRPTILRFQMYIHFYTTYEQRTLQLTSFFSCCRYWKFTPNISIL